MVRYDFNAQRLYVDSDLSGGAQIVCDADQANYIRNVLRLKAGDAIIVFNGCDGEWRSEIGEAGKRGVTLRVGEQVRPQEDGPDIDYLFAPLKRARLDYMVQKATEMGVARLRPVLTHRTVAERVNVERMRANAIEAAEQCGILSLPAITPPIELGRLLAERDAARWLVFCDEDAEVANPVAALSAVPPSPLAVLIGPEGGFAQDERAALLKQPNVVRLSLGPRILRADTAAVAALALVQAVIGDWRGV